MSIIDTRPQHQGNKRSEAAALHMFLNALGGSALAPLVALMLLALTTYLVSNMPFWVLGLLVLTIAGLWALIVTTKFDH
jgi:hypothetical protein